MGCELWQQGWRRTGAEDVTERAQQRRDEEHRVDTTRVLKVREELAIAHTGVAADGGVTQFVQSVTLIKKTGILGVLHFLKV